MKKSIILSSFLVLAFVLSLNAQQNDDYKFNYDNLWLRNPAALTQFNELGIGAYYLKQFTSIERAPTDIFLSLQYPIPYQSASLGVGIINESAGLLSQTRVNLSGSYKLKGLFKNSDYLSVGLSFNTSQFRIRGNELLIIDDDDPLGTILNETALNFNVGAGFFYTSYREIDYRDRDNIWQIGVSALKALPQNINFQNASLDENIYLYGLAKAIFPLTEGNHLSPMLEILYENERLININLSLQAHLINSVILGVSVDSDYAVGFQVGYKFDSNANDGHFILSAQSITPLGLIDNNINTGYGVSLQYFFESQFW